ncbi:MAG: conjugal transfer protein TraX [Lachnospiraceae bacterium]|nr:conjugal transfer protein TraX [Lachnospiraceae bacterium]
MNSGIDISIKDKLRLSCNVLKAIACSFMFIDHFGYGVIHRYMITHSMDMLPQEYQAMNTVYEISRGIGRLAFPIFCFFIVEGFVRTRSVKRYIIRLAVLALLSEIPFDLGLYGKIFYWKHQNVILTFVIALLMLLTLKFITDNRGVMSVPLLYLSYICTVIAFSDAAYLLKTDYSWKCMVLAAVLYFTRRLGDAKLIAGAAATCWEKYASASFVLLYFYDPDKKPRFRYFFYLFYPLNFLIVYAIAYLVI